MVFGASDNLLQNRYISGDQSDGAVGRRGMSEKVGALSPDAYVLKSPRTLQQILTSIA